MFKDYYKILGISYPSTSKEIKDAFRQQAKRWHPDHNPGMDTTSKMQDIVEAYSILKDEESRRLYNYEYEQFVKQNACKDTDASTDGCYAEYDFTNQNVEKNVENARSKAKDRNYWNELLTGLKDNAKKAIKGAWDIMKYYLMMIVVIGIIGLIILLCSHYRSKTSQTRTKKQSAESYIESEDKKESFDRFPFMSDGEWGFIDKKGTIVIKPQFDVADDFHEGLARVSIGGRWGYIDEKGKYIVNPQFDYAGDFHEGLAAVCIGDKYGYINKEGKYIVDRSLDIRTGVFSNMHVNDYRVVRDFHEGLAAVSNSTGNSWGYINRKDDKFIITPQFDEVGDFYEGLAFVRKGNRWGYIDKEGNYVANPQFDDVGDFHEGLACVSIGGRWGYVDKKGKYVVNPKFDGARGFHEGLAAVCSGDRWGYIDTEGEYVINPRFYSAGDFHEGLAGVSNGDRWGYIDTEGEYVINPRFYSAGDFHEGLARCPLSPAEDFHNVGRSKICYIDKKGEIVLSYVFVCRIIN